MESRRDKRRLAAILAADIVGYSRLMGADESGTLAQLKTHRKELLDPKIEDYGGRIVKTTGDGMLVEFRSVLDAVQCAVDVQSAMAQRNTHVPEDRRILFRMGINQGDVIVEDDDIYGDGINVASRLEGLAEPGGVCISGRVHEDVAGKLGLQFEYLGPQTLKNISRPVQAFSIDLASASSETTSGASLTLPDKPSIAVLPFDNMSGDPEQEYFSDGITEDIITALSRISWLFVIARNSSFSFKGQSPDVREVSKALGVRYVLEGSVRRIENRVRISAQLIDGTTGNHLWAEQYDRELKDIFEVQDEITETVVGAIEPELSRAEQDRTARKPPRNWDAWDHYQRSLWHVWRSTKEDTFEAIRLSERAIEMDPNFSSAFVAFAWANIWALFHGYSEAPAEGLKDARQAAEQALRLDGREAFAYFVRGSASFVVRDLTSALADVRRSIELNPSFALGHSVTGLILDWMGRPKEAIPHLETAERLSPRDPTAWLMMQGWALAHLLEKQFERAEAWSRRSIRVPNVGFWSHFIHVAILGHLERRDEARAALEELLRLEPSFSFELLEEILPTNHQDVRTTIVDGLRKAGLPE